MAISSIFATALKKIALLVCVLVVLLIRPGQCYPHKRDLNIVPEVINILENGQREQIKQTELLHNISRSIIIQEQTSMVTALANQSMLLESIHEQTGLRQEARSIIIQEQTSSMVTALANQSKLLESIHEQTGLRQEARSITSQEQTSSMMTMITALSNQSKLLESISTSLEQLTKSTPITARDCSDIASQGPYASGLYTISPWDDERPFKVYCDIRTDGGNSWIVIQRRLDGSVNFDCDWVDYKNGFGNLDVEFWLGLSKVFRLVRSGGPWQLRVDLEDFEGNKAYAQYNNFAVGNESSNFQLVSVGQYEGSAGDSLAYHVSRGFTTKDRDNDSHADNCGADYGAWWHNSCYSSNLNGPYRTSAQTTYNGIVWDKWIKRTTLKSAEMKIRLIG